MESRPDMVAIPVVIAMSETSPFHCQVFLSPYSHRHEGHETVEEYLNGARSFFPTNQDGIAKLINRDQINWLKAPRSDEEQHSYHLTETHVIMELIDGTRIEGAIEMNRPVGHARISDILNSHHEQFLCLRTDDDSCFVNKRFVRQVILQ